MLLLYCSIDSFIVVYKSPDQPATQSINQSINQPSMLLLYCSIDSYIVLYVTGPTSHSVNQLIRQPYCCCIVVLIALLLFTLNQPATQSTNQSINQPSMLLLYCSIDSYIVLYVTGPTSHSVKQSINQPAMLYCSIDSFIVIYTWATSHSVKQSTSHCYRRRRIKFEKKKKAKQAAAAAAMRDSLPVNGLCRPLPDGGRNGPITRDQAQVSVGVSVRGVGGERTAVLLSPSHTSHTTFIV